MILLGTLHMKKALIQPTELKNTIQFLCENYQEVLLSVSDVTHEKVLKTLAETQQQNFHYFFLPVLGAAKVREALLGKGFLKFGITDSFHICDFDRLITWQQHYPEELSAIANYTVKSSYVVLGRTKKAFESHPISWQETERLTNKVASDFFSIPNLDITAGSALISGKIIPDILKEPVYSMNDGQWPRIAFEKGFQIQYQACNGLMYLGEINNDNQEYFGKQLADRLYLSAAITNSLFQTKINRTKKAEN